MSSIMTRTRAIALITAILLVAGAAQAVSINFQVRMAYQIETGNFDPVTDYVDIAGTFNGWGTAPLTPLTDADGDSIYDITINDFVVSEFIEYKFRINGLWDGTEEFPGYGLNRPYVVQPTDNDILVWYNDEQDGGSVVIGDLHWWNDTVFYEIFVRSFNDSDGDGIGDLQGLTQKLDYLNDGDPNTDTDLGITGIWLMPINDSPSYHGYDAVDYRDINPDYGTTADFLAFLEAAHARGIKVIIDYVMNHCSSQHPWFVAASQNHPTYRDYFRWSPNDPGQNGPWGQDVWHWHNTGWYYGLFWGGMPDLNYENPAVKTAMFDTATYWLDTVGVDGFRLDAVLYILEDGDQLQNTVQTLQFWQDYNIHVKSVKPDMVSVGEAWTSSNTVQQYVTNDRLDLCFEFDLSYAILGAVNGSDADYLGTKIDQVYSLYPYLQFGTFLTNHDQDRVLNVLGFDEGKARAAAGISMLLPGVPFVYYGEEIGMIGNGAHEYIRSPMQWTSGSNSGFTTGTPWQPINSNYFQFNVGVEELDSQSLLSLYKQLIGVRNQSLALRRGTHERLTSSVAPVLAFVRSYEEETLLCLVNTSVDDQSGVTVTGTVTSLAPGDYTLANLMNIPETIDVTVTPSHEISGLHMAGYETIVFQFITTTGVTGNNDLPATGLMLEPAYPNPFNPSTTIRYSLPERSQVKIGIYDVAGRLVAEIQNGIEAKGNHEVLWQGLDAQGMTVSAGVYFVRLEAGTETRVTEIVLVK